MSTYPINTPPPKYSPNGLHDVALQRPRGGLSLPFVGLPWSLKPCLPSSNRRYNKEPSPDSKDALSCIVANSNVRCYIEDNEESPLPHGWRGEVHPEGDRFFWHGAKGLVTSQDPRDGAVSECLEHAFQRVNPRNPGRFDIMVYIELEFSVPPHPPSVTVSYYLVDPRSRQVFWNEDVDCGTIGLPQYQTKAQLKSTLTSEYWVHLDYYPVVLSFELTVAEPEAELISILAHGAIDDRTAPGSTCPWGAAECGQYIKLLKDLRSLDIRNAYRIASVARLYSALSRARHINSWGQTNARLDRLQGFVDFAPLCPSRITSAGEAATFFISVGILRRMSTLFNQRVVYHRHWDVFFQDIKGTWMQTTGISGLILLCDAALIASKLTNAATIASASLSGASIFIGIFLHQKHPQWKLATGPDISQYVISVEDYYQGLRPLSIILALPQAVSIYAALFFQLGLLLVVTNRVAEVQEAMWTVAAMSIGIVPLAASMLFFAPPKPETQTQTQMQQNPGTWTSLLRKWKGGGSAQERAV